MEETKRLAARKAAGLSRLDHAKRSALGQRQPTQAYRAYSKVMDTYAKRVQALTEKHVLSKLPVLGSGDPLDRAALEAGLQALQAELDVLARATYRSAYTAGKRAAQHAHREVNRMFNTSIPTGQEMQFYQHWFAEQNVVRMQRVGERQVRLMREAIEKHQEGESMREKILHSLWVSRNNSQLVARDEVYRFSEQEIARWSNQLGSEGWYYTTAHDEKVRHTHADLDGKFFKWGENPSTMSEPNCRCRRVPAETLQQ